VIVGVDFDNTIATYDDVFHTLAVKDLLIDATTGRHKRAVRDAIRRRPDGELDWQRLQALVYGPHMAAAVPSDGLLGFLSRCRRERVGIYVVSHKTEYANLGDSTNLHRAALDWLRDQGFFDQRTGVLRPDDVYFEPTRAKKIERIAALGCTHFIDDLEEIFLEPSFPSGVERILFAPHETGARRLRDVTVGRDWSEIGRVLFGC